MSADSPFTQDEDDDGTVVGAVDGDEWSNAGEVAPTPFGVLNFHVAEVRYLPKYTTFVVDVICDQHPYTGIKLGVWADGHKLRQMADALGIETRMQGTTVQVRGGLDVFKNTTGKGVWADYLHQASGERRGQFALGVPKPKSSPGFDKWASEQNDGEGLDEDQTQAIKQSAAGVIRPEHAELFD